SAQNASRAARRARRDFTRPSSTDPTRWCSTSRIIRGWAPRRSTPRPPPKRPRPSRCTGGAVDFDASIGARQPMMKRETIKIADIYVPVKRRATLKPATVQELAQDMLENGQKSPILVRRDGDRFVLVEGLHRLEACKALGEETILGYLVQAAKH